MTPLETIGLQVATETAKTANGLLGRLLGSSADELGTILSTNLKPRLLANQIKNLKKVEKIVADSGMTLKQVNLKVLFPYLENVALEEDETLQDMWAKLFANYLDADKSLTLIVYPSILSQLSTDEVNLLLHMNENDGYANYSPYGYYQAKINPPSLPEEAIVNLLRLGLIEEIEEYIASGTPSEHPSFGNDLTIERDKSYRYLLGSLGKGLIEACTR